MNNKIKKHVPIGKFYKPNTRFHIPNNQLWYHTIDDTPIVLTDEECPERLKFFNSAGLISNTYYDGIGVMTFNKELTYIGEHAFDGDSTLTAIIMPDSIKRIGECAFNMCQLLSFAHLSGNIERIGNEAFAFCESLPSMWLPNKVKEIGSYAFWCCYSLRTIHISCKTKIIQEHAFEDCPELLKITYNGSKHTWNWIDKKTHWNDIDPESCTIYCNDGVIKKL